MFGVVRRNPLGAAVAALVVVGLGVSTTVASGHYSNASATRCGDGYGSCPSTDTGYRLLSSTGKIYSFGTEKTAVKTAKGKGPFVGIAGKPGGSGYWVVNSLGRVTAFNTGNKGEPLGKKFTNPITAIAATPDGGGYWITTSGGHVFNFGDAKYYGQELGKKFSGTIVGIAGTLDGKGYRLVSSAGYVFNFGDAKPFRGFSTNGIVAITSLQSAGGYWLVDSAGTVYPHGAAKTYKRNSERIYTPVKGLIGTPDGAGYGLIGAHGGFTSYGNWTQHGDAPSSSIVGGF